MGGGGSGKPSRIRQWLRRADDATGRRASTGWGAARGTDGGVRARYRAAKDALSRKTSHRPWVNAGFAGGAGLLAAIGALFGLLRGKALGWADRTIEEAEPTEHRAEAGPAETQAEATRAEGAATPDPATTQQIPRDEPTPTPTAAPAAPTAPTGPTQGGNTVGLPHADSANELLSNVGSYETQDAYEVIDQSIEWARAVDNWARSIRAYVERLESIRMPIAPAGQEAIYELYEGTAKLIPIAERIPEAMGRPHEHDMARRDTPRGDESKWNI